METELTKKVFTVEDYYRMDEAGVFAPGERVELINGEIVEMSPIGSRHAACVNRLNQLLLSVQGRAIVSIQNPSLLSVYSVPQPDVMLLEPKDDFYASALPEPKDVLMMIEVSDTTLRYDRRIKAPLYASAGIPEVWVVDLKGDRIHVYRNPGGDSYRTTAKVDRSGTVSPLAFPDLVLSADAILL
jgi:Uma2 family endonuclease